MDELPRTTARGRSSFIQYSKYFGPHFLSRFCAIDQNDVRILCRKLKKYVSCGRKRFQLFKLIRCLSPAVGYAIETHTPRHIDQKHFVGFWELGRHGRRNRVGVPAAGTLVSDGRIEVTVEQNRFAPGEGGKDHLADVLPAIFGKESEFFFERQAAGNGRVSQVSCPTDRRSARGTWSYARRPPANAQPRPRSPETSRPRRSPRRR